MGQAPSQIARRGLLRIAVGLTALAAGLTGLGFANLYASRLRAPVTLLAGGERLGQVLERAPWISGGAEGPVVWALTDAACPACVPFATEDLPALERAGYEVRVIFIADDAAPQADQDRAIDLARARAGAEGPVEPGERAGYLAWGQAVRAEVSAILRANEVAPQLPLLIWRKGPEWRALAGRDPRGPARLDADFVSPIT